MPAWRLPLLPSSPHRALDTASWAQIQKKLQDFCQDTQVVGKEWWGPLPTPCPGSWLMPPPGRAGTRAGTADGPGHHGRAAAL